VLVSKLAQCAGELIDSTEGNWDGYQYEGDKMMGYKVTFHKRSATLALPLSFASGTIVAGSARLVPVLFGSPVDEPF